MAHLSNAARSALTRRTLLDAAQELFATQGYGATSVPAIVRRAKRTPGALQYHFADKATLFQAVCEEQDAALIHYIVERVQEADGDPWQRTVVACHAFVDKAADPRVCRIFYLDAPAVLGRKAVERTGPWLTLIRQLVEPLRAEGFIASLPVEPLSRLVWAICSQAGRYIAYAADPLQAQEERRPLLLRLLGGLRLGPERRPATG